MQNLGIKSLKELGDRLPDHAKDLRLNLVSLESIDSLTEEQVFGTILASAYASGGSIALRELDALAADRLSPEARRAASAAASLMSMNNIYYRFVHLASNPVYGSLPARLRMQGLRNHGVDQATFELWALAVSAINGCGMCIDSHEKVLTNEGLSNEAIQDAIRIAAVVHAVSVVLDAESVFE